MAMTLPVLNATALTESGGDPVVTKYYFYAGKRVAMDRDGVVQWLVGDHLGTTSLVLNADGTVHSEARHYPYGEERWRWPQEGTFPTDYRFTGQRTHAYIGLVHMGARFYDPALGRWISADSIVPDPTNPKSFDRYAYVRNSPLNYVDPTGHMEDGECGPWNEYCEGPSPPSPPTDATTWELFLLWLLEELPETTIMDEQYDLTQQVMNIEGVNRAREEFYRRMEAGALDHGTDYAHAYRFGLNEYLQEAFAAVQGQTLGSALGSFVAHVHLNDNDTVTFTVTDPKNLSSFSKNLFYFVPDYLGEDVTRSRHSWEGVLTGQQDFSWPSDIFMRSIFEPRSRGDAGPFDTHFQVGGAVRLRFTWTEPLRVEGSED